MVENAFLKLTLFAITTNQKLIETTNEITTTIETIISIVGANFIVVAIVISIEVICCDHYWNKSYYQNNNHISKDVYFNSGWKWVLEENKDIPIFKE